MNHKAEHKMLTLAVVSTCTTYFNIQELHFSQQSMLIGFIKFSE